MEIILIGVVAVALYWIWSSRSTSQARLRYEVHKDALAAAKELLAKYPHGKVSHLDEAGNDHGDKWAIDVKSAPLEYRQFLENALKDIAEHVHGTQIPHELGHADLARELLQSMTTARRLTGNEMTNEGRASCRRYTYTKLAEAFLKRAATEGDAFGARTTFGAFGACMTALEISDLEEAVTWFPQAGAATPPIDRVSDAIRRAKPTSYRAIFDELNENLTRKHYIEESLVRAAKVARSWEPELAAFAHPS